MVTSAGTPVVASRTDGFSDTSNLPRSRSMPTTTPRTDCPGWKKAAASETNVSAMLALGANPVTPPRKRTNRPNVAMWDTTPHTTVPSTTSSRVAGSADLGALISSGLADTTSAGRPTLLAPRDVSTTRSCGKVSPTASPEARREQLSRWSHR